jgi:hypothetical protein
MHATNGLLICTLISEDQGLEKSRSFSSLSKISDPARSPPWKKLRLYYEPEKYPGAKPKKEIKVCRTWNFTRVWNRPWLLKALIFRNQGAD